MKCRVLNRKQFRVYVVLVTCLTALFYIALNLLFQQKDKYSDYNADNYFMEIQEYAENRSQILTGRVAKLLKHEHVADICKDPEVRRFIRHAPYVRQKRLYYNNTKVCTCSVPKAASTSLGRLMLMAEFPDRAAHFSSMAGNKIHVTKALTYLNTETCYDKPGLSFFVTRDPYARLYSAYIDKVFLEKFGTVSVLIDAICNDRISKENLMNASWLRAFLQNTNALCTVGNATFEDFLFFVTKSRRLDPHYTPVSLLCNPCKDPVEYMFKQEELKKDSAVLSEYLDHVVNSNRSQPIDLSLRDYVGDNGIENLIRTYHTAWKARLANRECSLSVNSRTTIYERLWEAMKVLGNIDENLDYIPEIFADSDNTQLKHPTEILDEFTFRKIKLLTPERRVVQRNKYLVRAYRGVSERVINDIQTLFQLDFRFFGYDVTPPHKRL